MAADTQHDKRPGSPALEKLLTADQSILLNTVDKLRNHGVSKYIKLPQIIVCGDQSSGKSSVLEAISRISFPRGEGICTTFPTELALRRDLNRKVKVQLKPSLSRPESERLLLASYQPPVGQIEDIEPLIKDAKDHLKRNAGTDRKADSFFEDILHIEVTDPKWPPLSLVDLPGLISAPNPNQTSEDVTIVNEMVSKYMENPKSIILAVISASYELPLQKVFTMIQKFDPLGTRTICVVTKPDNASPGTDDLPQFVHYAQNKLPGYRFDLGWHVVMNRGTNSHSQSPDERDKSEKDFFAQASWNGRLHRDQLGIVKLRDRLSKLLERHTRAEMPQVLKQIKETLTEARDELSKLGPARHNSDDQRIHLTTIGQHFQGLVRQAVNGHYDDPSFFLPDLPESDPRKLRAALQNMNEQFAKRMHNKGHAKRIVDEIGSVFGSLPKFQPNVSPFFISKTLNEPQPITRSTYIIQIKALLRKNRGVELIGSPNLRLVRDLFLDQSRPWRVFATEHLENVLQIVHDHLSAVSNNVASPETAAAIRRELVYDAVDIRHRRVIEKLEELLRPHEKGHPITYDLSYVENSRKLIKADVKARLERYQRRNAATSKSGTSDKDPQESNGLQIHQVISALKLDDKDMEEIDCTDILNSSQAYYDGALRTFIDNVAVLAVEGCLIDGLENIFSATAVAKMNKQTLSTLGGESEQAQAERHELEGKVAALHDAQRECLRAGAIQEHQTNKYTSSIPGLGQTITDTPVPTTNTTGKTTTSLQSRSPTPSGAMKSSISTNTNVTEASPINPAFKPRFNTAKPGDFSAQSTPPPSTLFDFGTMPTRTAGSLSTPSSAAPGGSSSTVNQSDLKPQPTFGSDTRTTDRGNGGLFGR